MAIDPTTRKGSGVGKMQGRVARALARVRKWGNATDGMAVIHVELLPGRSAAKLLQWSNLGQKAMRATLEWRDEESAARVASPPPSLPIKGEVPIELLALSTQNHCPLTSPS